MISRYGVTGNAAKAALAALLLLVRLLCCAGLMAAQTDMVEPRLTGKAGELALLPASAYATEFWRINNWKKVQKAEIAFPSDRTPTNSPCIRIDFLTPGGGCNVITPAFKAAGTWRKQHYGAITFWARGDCRGRKAKFSVTTARAAYSWFFTLDSDKWKKITLTVASAYTRKGDRKDLNQIKYAMFSAEQPLSFLVGDLRMEPATRQLPIVVAPGMVIPVIKDAAVTLDGKLDEPAWNQARKVKHLLLTGSGGLPQENTELRIFANDKALYIAAIMADRDTSGLLAKQTMRDSQVWQDDCLEIFVDGNLDARTYKHFILNSRGTIQDYRYYYSPVADTFTYDHKWNPDWKHASSITPRTWTVEVELPFADLNIRPGSVFALQVGRENHSGGEISALTRTTRFTTAANYAIAMLGRADAGLREISLQKEPSGRMTLRAQADRIGPASVTLHIADPYGKLTTCRVDAQVDAAGQMTLPFLIQTPVDGEYRVTLAARIGHRAMLPAAVSFALHLPPEIEFGDIFLNPRPKKMRLAESRFTFDSRTPVLIAANCSKRTRRTARFLRAELRDLTGLILPITDEPAAAKSFSLAVADKVRVQESDGQTREQALRPEGYWLEVTPARVRIVGADEPGLYYGVVTLLQLFRATLLRKQAPEIHCAQILDWPDKPMRIITHWLGAKRRRKEPGYKVADLKHWLKTWVAGSKYNYWSPMLNENFTFDREVGVMRLWGEGDAMTKNDYAELVRFAQEHFIHVVPAFQSGGHSHHLVLPHPELQEPGYDHDHDQVNVQHPDYYRILFSIYDDILSVTPGAKYFMIWHDEWWHHPTAAVRDEFMGRKRWEIYRDNLLRIHAYFKKRGITMMMFGDMLASEHNGGHPFFCAKATKGLPRDIVICNWSSGTAPNSARELHDKGFKVLDVYNQFRPAPANDIPIVSGFGTIAYGHFLQTFWYSRDQVIPDYTNAIPRAADYAWNLAHDAQLPLGEWRRKYLNSVNALYSFPARRAVGFRFRPVDLAPTANLKSSNWFGKPSLAPVFEPGNRTIAFIPMRIAGRQSCDAVAATKEQPDIKIELGGTLARCLFFLQAAYLPKKERAAFKKRSTGYLLGVPLGEIRIEYEDGPTEILPLRMGYNTLETTPLAKARFMPGVRYTHDTRTASGKLASLYLIEWANPYYQRLVKRVVLHSYGTEAVPIIYAVTVAR